MLKNIEACKKIAEIVKTSLGPNGIRDFHLQTSNFFKGMKKMIINHLEKIFVTSDAATIMREVTNYLNLPLTRFLDRGPASSCQDDRDGI